jgi:hypothetical protein
MSWLLGGPWSPIGWSVGFVKADITTVADTLLHWLQGLGHDLQVDRELPRYPQCLRRLELLQAPWTRELLIGHGDGWTAYLNNDRNGGDPWPASSYVAKLLGVHGVIAVHQPPTKVGHASTQLQLLGPEGEPPLHYVRTLAAHAEDGRWSWDTSGAPLPFEDLSRYGARRVRDRLTRQLLVGYLAALGIRVDDDARYGRAVLVTQRVRWPSRTESLQQARVRWQLD